MMPKKLLITALVFALQNQGVDARIFQEPRQTKVESQQQTNSKKAQGDGVRRKLGGRSRGVSQMGKGKSSSKGKGSERTWRESFWMWNLYNSERMRTHTIVSRSADQYDYYHDYYYYDVLQDECTSIIAGSWSYVTDASYTEIDVDGDSMISPGDVNSFNGALVNVVNRADGSVIATGTMDGTCTVVPTFSIERDFCQFAFDFGDAGSVSIQGSLEKVSYILCGSCFCLCIITLNRAYLFLKYLF